MRDENKCVICRGPCEPCMSFGKMPLANGFLSPDKFDREYFFELLVALCPRCTMFQLVKQPERERMFNESYAFFSGTSKGMALHFEKFAEQVRKEYLHHRDPFVAEIGSNDGIMLQNFAKAGIRHLGVEPSKNVAEVARGKGITTVAEFFDEELAQNIAAEYGQADAILAANVMCHIPYLHRVAAGIKRLLKADGVLIFEDPYLGNVIESAAYDQIYDEHAFLFSVSAIRFLFEQYDMEIFDVEPQETHGGSMRYMIARKGCIAVSDRVARQLEKERIEGLDKPETYERFREKCERSREALMKLLNDLRRQGKRIVGYAATSKSTTIINYCRITTEHIEYISDTTPIKQGKFSPGAHIPVLPYENFARDYPDYALLFAYNHMEEIMVKERNFVASGGKWIVFVPEVKVLEGCTLP